MAVFPAAYMLTVMGPFLLHLNQVAGPEPETNPFEGSPIESQSFSSGSEVFIFVCAILAPLQGFLIFVMVMHSNTELWNEFVFLLQGLAWIVCCCGGLCCPSLKGKGEHRNGTTGLRSPLMFGSPGVGGYGDGAFPQSPDLRRPWRSGRIPRDSVSSSPGYSNPEPIGAPANALALPGPRATESEYNYDNSVVGSAPGELGMTLGGASLQIGMSPQPVMMPPRRARITSRSIGYTGRPSTATDSHEYGTEGVHGTATSGKDTGSTMEGGTYSRDETSPQFVHPSGNWRPKIRAMHGHVAVGTPDVFGVPDPPMVRHASAQQGFVLGGSHRDSVGPIGQPVHVLQS